MFSGSKGYSPILTPIPHPPPFLRKTLPKILKRIKLLAVAQTTPDLESLAAADIRQQALVDAQFERTQFGVEYVFDHQVIAYEGAAAFGRGLQGIVKIDVAAHLYGKPVVEEALGHAQLEFLAGIDPVIEVYGAVLVVGDIEVDT